MRHLALTTIVESQKSSYPVARTQGFEISLTAPAQQIATGFELPLRSRGSSYPSVCESLAQEDAVHEPPDICARDVTGSEAPLFLTTFLE